MPRGLSKMTKAFPKWKGPSPLAYFWQPPSKTLTANSLESISLWLNRIGICLGLL